jgi:hypothetical protein
MSEKWKDVQLHRQFIHDMLRTIGRNDFLTVKESSRLTKYGETFRRKRASDDLHHALVSARNFICTQRSQMSAMPDNFMSRQHEKATDTAQALFRAHRPSARPSFTTTLKASEVGFDLDRNKEPVITILTSYAATTGQLWGRMAEKPNQFMLRSQKVGTFPDDIEVHRVRFISYVIPKKADAVINDNTVYVALDTIKGDWTADKSTMVRARDALRKSRMAQLSNMLKESIHD